DDGAARRVAFRLAAFIMRRSKVPPAFTARRRSPFRRPTRRNPASHLGVVTMIRPLRFSLAVLFCIVALVEVRAEDEYQVQALAEAAPADDVSPDIAAALSPTGFKVMKGENRTVCSFWPAKQWAVQPDFKPSAAMLYPLTMGEFIGVINFKRDAQD